MNIILVSDVFGKTPALIKLGAELNAKTIVDPYDGININFKNETEASSYFVEHVGLDSYLLKLRNIADSLSSTSTLIGFSIGASIIWRLSDNSSVKNIERGICYYGSQIRNFKDINPSFELTMIFPRKEEHFDVLGLQSELSIKQRVKTMNVRYLHGFMNLYSTNFSQAGYVEQLNYLGLNVS